MKLLVYEVEFFYDGHGDQEEGATKKYIIPYKEFLTKLDEEKSYNKDIINLSGDEEDFKELLKDCETTNNEYFAEDGYNCTIKSVDFKEITDEEAERIQNIINEYEKI